MTDESALSRSLGSGILQTLLAQVLSTGSTVLIVLLTSRGLGPDGKGVLTLALLATRVAEMAVSVGFGHALMFQRARDEWTEQAVLGAAYFYWGMTALGLAGFGVLAWTQLGAWFPTGFSAPAAALVVGVTGARLLHYFLGSILLGANRLRTYNMLNLVSSAITAAVCAGVAWYGVLTVEATLGAYMAGAVGAGAGAAWLLRGRLAWPPWPLLRACIGYGAQIQLGQVAQFLNNRLDTILVGAMLPLREVGLYSAAVAICEIVWRLPNVVATVLYPKVAGAAPKEGAAMTAHVCRATQALVALACLGLALTGKPLVLLMFGPEYADALGPTLLLLPGMVTLSLFTLLYHDLAGRGRPGAGMAASVAGLLVTLGLDLFLIPRWGIWGAATASSIAYSVSALWVLLVFVRATGCRVQNLLVPTRTDLRAWWGLLGR